MSTKKRKISKLKIKKIEKIADDKQLVEAEIELNALEHELPKFEQFPVEITHDAQEPEKKGFWNFFFGKS